MSLSYVSGGYYLSSITNSQATVNMSYQALMTVYAMVSATEATTEEAIDSPMNVTGQVIDGDGLSTHTTFTSSVGGASSYTCVLHAVVDNSAGVEAINYRPEFTMGGTISPNYSFYAATIEHRFPVPGGDMSRVLVMLPGTQSTVVRWDQITTLTDLGYSNPGLQDRGGEHPLNPSGDTTDLNESNIPKEILRAGSASFVPVFAFYNLDTGDGCIIRSTDILGRGKAFKITRDSGTNELVVRFVFAPVSCATGVAGASDEDFDYSCQIRPFHSPDPDTAWYDVLRYHQERCSAEGHPADDLGYILDRVDLPTRLTDMLAFGNLAVGADSSGFDFSKYTDQVTRLVGNFSLDYDELLVSIYDYWQGTIGKDFPTIVWQTGAASAIQDIYDLGVTNLLYSIPLHNGVWDGSAGLPPALGINADLSVDKDDNPIIGETPVLGSDSGGAVYIAPSWLNDTNTDELYDYVIGQQTAAVGVKIHGEYDDAGNAFAPPPNADAAIGDDDRNFGSKTWWPKNRARIQRYEDRLTAAGITSPIVFQEHPNEMSVGYNPICFNNMIGPATSYNGDSDYDYITPRVPNLAICWSRNTLITDFASFGDGPSGIISPIPGYAAEVELMCSLYSYNWHNHQIPSFLKYYGVLDRPYFDDGFDQEYQDWADYMDTMFFAQKAANKRWRSCKKLRDLPNSQHIQMINAAVASDPSSIITPASYVHSSVLYDDDNDEVVLRFSNWSISGYNGTDRSISATLDDTKWPELGSAARDVYLWNWVTGSRSRLADRAAGMDYDLTVYVPAGFIGAVIMTPADVAPALMPAVTENAQSITGLTNAVQTIFGDE